MRIKDREIKKLFAELGSLQDTGGQELEGLRAVVQGLTDLQEQHETDLEVKTAERGGATAPGYHGAEEAGDEAARGKRDSCRGNYGIV